LAQLAIVAWKVEDRTLSRLFVIYIIDFANLAHAFEFLGLEALAFTCALYDGMWGECAEFRIFFDGWYKGLSDRVLNKRPRGDLNP
jgi:hypothetical protein